MTTSVPLPLPSGFDAPPAAGRMPPAPAAAMPGDVGPANVEQARILMHEVCSLAGTALAISRDRAAALCEDDVESLRTHVRVLNLLIDRIGWVADVSLRRLGGTGCFSDAEGWMLQDI